MRQNNQNLDSGFSSSEAQEALQSLRGISAEPSMYLKTRVLAHAREQKAAKISFFSNYFWPSVAATFFLFVASLFIFKNQLAQDPVVASYQVGQPYVIRMDIRPYKEAKIAYAEVVLSDENIQFSSAQFAEISQQKTLTVSWDSMIEKQFLPIVIRGLQSGKSKVTVNFYDLERKLINSQKVNLNFKGG